MTEDSPAALQVALAYYQAWTNHDVELAMTYIAEDIVCQASAGRLAGGAAFRGFMEPFVQMVTGSRLIAAFGDGKTALLMYEAATGPVRDAPGAEFAVVADGKISQLTIIFDRLPFEMARRAAAAGPGAG